jgi:hypothetical protein
LLYLNFSRLNPQSTIDWNPPQPSPQYVPVLRTRGRRQRQRPCQRHLQWHLQWQGQRS